MKKILQLLMLIAVTMTNTANAQWLQVTTNTTEEINDMYFFDDSIGYAVVYHSIIKSSDGGNNWNTVIQDTSLVNQLSIVTTTDSVFCFGSDSLGSRFKISFPINATTYTKTTINYLPINPVFFNNDIWFVDLSDHSLYKYNHGNRIFVFYGLDEFYTSSTYIAASDPTHINFSYDSGLTWQSEQFTTSPLSSSPYQSFFNGSDTLYAVTNYPLTLFYSFDAGLTWNYNQTFRNGDYLYFYDALKIIGVYGFTNFKHIIYTTNNGGQTYSLDTLSHPVNYCFLHSNQNTFVYGDNGVIYKKANTWSAAGLQDNETAFGKINIYPNPTNGTIILEFPSDTKVNKLDVYNPQGQLIKSFLPSERILKTSGIAKGQYILSLETPSGIMTKSFIKE